ncbi:RHS repeat-associated core domain-containing protein [Microbacterium sp. SMR1]|uniref:RHS repeat-associated core domain-containing protein n=1 Tax=Microbacterium sp. SMR1 TaxID=1497340 RepID=UPI0015EC3E4C|nr:RHS repeat-associated core domain-containing protein [Microbacterium sp. SMR1]
MSSFAVPSNTVAGAPGTGELPWFPFHDFSLSSDSTAQVNLANGNLLLKANDLIVPGPGYALRHDRFYNGLSTQRGSLGGGWHSSNGAYDIGLVNMGSYADYHGPNGLHLRFERVGTTADFKGPPGSNMTARQDTSSGDYYMTLTENKSGDQMMFSTHGILSATRDRNGVGSSYSYSGGDLMSIYHTSGRSLSMQRDWASGGTELQGVKDSAGREVKYTYDPNSGALKTATSPDGKVTTYTYDATGRLASIVLPAAAAATTTISFSYDSSHRVTKVTQQSGVTTSFAYNAGTTTVTDPNGKVSTYTIDSSGRVTAAKDALNRTRTQEWTANSDIAKTTDGFGTNNSTYTYDGSGNRTNAQMPTGAAAAAVYAVGANCSAPNTGTAFQPKCSTDDAGNKKQYQYDAAGNQTKQTDTTGSTPVVEFERTYGNCGGFGGQVCTTKDGNGNITTYAYNSKGDLTKVTPPAPMGATTYTHDSLGRVATVTDGNGHKTSYQYDIRDRLVLTTFADGQNVVSSYYDNGLERTRVDSGGGSSSYSYDHQGRIVKQTGPRSGVSQTYTYDKAGNMLTYADGGGTTTYTYDAANQLKSLREPNGICPSAGAPAADSGCVLFEYDVNGAETKRLLPGGATTVTTRDGSGRPTRITSKAADGSTAVDIGYSYAAANGDRANVQKRTAHKEQGITAGAVTSYTYDSRNRLTLAEEKTSTTVSASWAYKYDANSNRTQQVRAGSTGATAGTITYGYNAANQLTSATGQAATWTYDGAGNQTRAGSTSVSSTFGDRGEASKIGTIANTYFGAGNTDRLTAGGLKFNNSAIGLMQRYDDSITHNYTRTPDGQVTGLRGQAQHYYIHDHLGSVVGMFTTKGTYSGGYSYDPYGETRFMTSGGSVEANNIRYIGEYRDAQGLYKLGARYYEPAQGRFTQMDPSGQEKNPYAYASCNPINTFDPSGLAGASAAARIVGSATGLYSTYNVLTSQDLAGYAAGFAVELACAAGVAALGVSTFGAGFVGAVGCFALGEVASAGVSSLIQ